MHKLAIGILLVISFMLGYWLGTSSSTQIYKSESLLNSQTKSGGAPYIEQANISELPPTDTIENPHIEEKIKSLTAQIDELNVQLLEERKSRIANNQYQSTKKEKKDRVFAEIKYEQANEIMSEPYAKTASGMGGTIAEYFEQHINDEKDFEWSVAMEQKIKDFIHFHRDGQYLGVDKIECNRLTCMFLVRELKKYAWRNVSDDIREQSWFNFMGAGSSSLDVDDTSYVFTMYGAYVHK